MNTKEILIIVALLILGMCLLCGLFTMTMKGHKGKQTCNHACSLSLFVAVVLVGVSQLLKPEHYHQGSSTRSASLECNDSDDCPHFWQWCSKSGKCCACGVKGCRGIQNCPCTKDSPCISELECQNGKCTVGVSQLLGEKDDFTTPRRPHCDTGDTVNPTEAQCGRAQKLTVGPLPVLDVDEKACKDIDNAIYDVDKKACNAFPYIKWPPRATQQTNTKLYGIPNKSKTQEWDWMKTCNNFLSSVNKGSFIHGADSMSHDDCLGDVIWQKCNKPTSDTKNSGTKNLGILAGASCKYDGPFLPFGINVVGPS